MKFRTELHIEKQSDSISQQDEILAIGSCFVENVGLKLKHLKFNININPFGIIFNPYSIAKILNQSLDSKIDLEDECEVIMQQNVFKSYDYHSKFNANSYNNFIALTDTKNNEVKKQLKSADYLILTYGTAWVYRLVESNKIVANCHKEPQSKFKKERLQLDMLVDVYINIFNRLFEQNPNLKIILTVSPVRHLKDGMIENNQSKSVLLLLCSTLSSHFKENVIYFPSYDIQMDDLRDYRFYNSDLIHPNQMAIDYIFDKFSIAFFTEPTQLLNSKITKLYKLENHQFLNASDEDKQKHQSKIEALKREIEQKR